MADSLGISIWYFFVCTFAQHGCRLKKREIQKQRNYFCPTVMNVGLDEQGVPRCEPFLKIQDVFSWSPPEFCCNGTKFDAQWKSLRNFENHPTGNENLRPQLLLCHDMRGGYLDDRFTQGSDNSEAYRFYNWSAIDTFIYFSHKFVTVPPFGWICSAHEHGVNVLGTIITEWDDGKAICKQLLQSKEYIDDFVSKLVEIMLFHGFDGWLINIENEIQPTDIPHLRYFVQQLTVKCRSHLEYSKVLWYDSVTRSGELLWQNELNDENEMFFEVSDGIFLNYLLTEDNLETSLLRAKAANRQFDVYTGVDVFGRCTPGGGGFNCKEIMERIIPRGLSCALFAHSWVYEICGMEEFDANEAKFWQLLSDYLPLKSTSLPISTSFCRGYGQKYFLEGKVVSECGWHNLSLQQPQPSYLCDYQIEEAFIGGGCLRLSSHGSPAVKSLFRISLADRPSLHLGLSYIWKVHGQKGSCDLGLVFAADSTDSPSAMVFMDNQSVDRKQVIDTLNSTLFTNSRISPENVMFTLSDNQASQERGGWIETSYSLNCDPWEFSKKTIILAALLMPKQMSPLDSKPELTPAISLGHLKVHQQNTVADWIPSRINICPNICLRISRPSLKSIVSHQCFSMKCEGLEEELGGGASRPQGVDGKDLEDLNLSWRTADTDIEGHETLYFLRWSASNSKAVAFCLIFCMDSSDKEHFVGSSVSDCYIFKPKLGLNFCPTKFIIQPVLKGVYLLGNKFVVKIDSLGDKK